MIRKAEARTMAAERQRREGAEEEEAIIGMLLGEVAFRTLRPPLHRRPGDGWGGRGEIHPSWDDLTPYSMLRQGFRLTGGEFPVASSALRATTYTNHAMPTCVFCVVVRGTSIRRFSSGLRPATAARRRLGVPTTGSGVCWRLGCKCLGSGKICIDGMRMAKVKGDFAWHSESIKSHLSQATRNCWRRSQAPLRRSGSTGPVPRRWRLWPLDRNGILAQ